MNDRSSCDPRGSNQIRAWVEANRGQLPEQFDDFVAHPMAYRRAIFAELSLQVRSRLWSEHLARYRQDHPDLNQEQRAVLDQAQELFADPDTFATVRTEPDPELDQLKDAAIAAYGHTEARALIATLGPEEDHTGGTRPEH